jgi:hypothetical protein
MFTGYLLANSSFGYVKQQHGPLGMNTPRYLASTADFEVYTVMTHCVNVQSTTMFNLVDGNKRFEEVFRVLLKMQAVLALLC